MASHPSTSASSFPGHRRSRWRTAPAERRAAAWSKACLLRCSSAGDPEPLGDAAHVEFNGARIGNHHGQLRRPAAAFPGGSIGELAVNGTVNDLAVSGARAEALVVTFVLEAGLPTRRS